MPIRRTYHDHGDACRAANALDLVGDRWTLIVVREVILGPKRFADLLQSVRGITPAVLADRLRSLQQSGIVDHVPVADPAGSRAYVATEWGRGLEPVLAALGRWYSAGPDPGTDGGMTPDAIVIAMRTMAPGTPSPAPPVVLRLRDERRADPPVHIFHTTADGGFSVEPGTAPAAPAATVTADSTVWSRVLFGDLDLTAVHIDGDRGAVASIVRLYQPAT